VMRRCDGSNANRFDGYHTVLMNLSLPTELRGVARSLEGYIEEYFYNVAYHKVVGRNLWKYVDTTYIYIEYISMTLISKR
jgi:hypothetical protein